MSDFAPLPAGSPWLLALALCPVFIALLLATGRSPFDYPEAESELISGSITELGGLLFSLLLLTDMAELAFGHALALLPSFTALNYSLAMVWILLATLLGRVILIRFNIAEVNKLLFTKLIWCAAPPLIKIGFL